MTAYGGDSGSGTLFQINTNGSGFSLLHEFTGGGNDGSFPAGSLALSGLTLYGMTEYGGDSDYGTVFSYVIPEPGTSALLLAGMAGLGLLRRRSVRR